MFVYRLQVNPLLIVDVKLAASSPDEHRSLDFVGLPKQKDLPEVDILVDMVRDEVQSLTGLYGHLLGDVTTPIDLHTAFSEGGLSCYSPQLLEGHDIVTSYVPESLPPGAVH